ncbi:MAG: hypothetical protein VZQ81_05860 [Succiniclasticum sp.]|jgi:hypothetical protein|nr:hypothetical protein [Succiniclasticum sp.]MEE3479529.1 hypothetical protein [Succiniclasticum sp.]
MQESYFSSLLETGPFGISYFNWILSLSLAYFVHNDARNHNVPHAAWWSLGTFLAWIIFLPLYLFSHVRGRKEKE